MSRGPNPQVSFADVEFVKQGIFLAPHLQAISNFLEEHEELIEKVRGDLQRGLKNPATGRNGLTPSQVLRSLILMRVKDWDYRELRERIADGYTSASPTSSANRCPNTMPSIVLLTDSHPRPCAQSMSSW